MSTEASRDAQRLFRFAPSVPDIARCTLLDADAKAVADTPEDP